MIRDFAKALRGLTSDREDAIGALFIVCSIIELWFLFYALGGK